MTPSIYRSNSQQPREIFYVYAVTSRDNCVLYPEKGIDDAFALQCVPYNNVQALVSPVPYAVFNREHLLDKISDSEWLERSVREHATIVSAIHAETGIIPMRFLTLCKDIEEVQGFLAGYEEEIENTLATVKGTSEWGVKIFCNKEELMQNVLAQDCQIKALDRKIDQLQKGASFLFRKKRSRLAKEIVMKMCAQCSDECHERLIALATDAENVASQNGVQSEGSNVLILNGAYLVKNRQASGFKDMVLMLNRQFNDQGFSVTCSGPWPPYHFVKEIT